MGMKAVLINPPRRYLIEPESQAPFGLLYIAAILEQEGWECQYVDLALEDEIPEADLYGITANSPDYDDAVEIAKGLKSRDGLVVLGGPHVTGMMGHVDLDIFDAVVIDEGENSIRQIVREWPHLSKSYMLPVVEDLDTIPFPARHLLSVQGTNIFAYRKRYWEGETTCLVTMRGCPYRCGFCAAGRRHKVRFRSADNLIAEIQHVVETYDIREFRISDDHFALKRSRVLEVLPRMKECDIFWRASIRVDSVDPKMLELMAESGCVEISYGVESGDPRVLKRINKGATLEQAANAMKWTHDAGITVRSLMVAGLPGETPESAYKTIEFMEQTRDWWDIATLSNFVPFPGSPIWNNPEAFGVKKLTVKSYNFYLWTPGPDDEPMMRPIHNNIELEDLSDEEMTKNKRILRAYFIGLDKVNRG